MRLDEEKLEALRSWGERLREGGGEESAAVGRAILMLVEEIDRLHVDLWHARMQPGDTKPDASGETAAAEPEPITLSLYGRLRGVRRRHADPAPQPVERAGETETDATRSAQSWIDALRRHE